MEDTLLIRMDGEDWKLGYCKDDPVRPHLPLAWRATQGRQVFGLEEEGDIQAIVCVAYCKDIPLTEKELDELSTPDGEYAVFYTVWSYKKGAGRQMVLDTAKHLKEARGINHFVTLSPLTQMAERIHTRNGAKLLKRGEECQNFEYKL